MSKNISISCIIIGYNAIKQLPELLLSINQQNYNGKDVEIIYVDDGSSDGSLGLFNQHALKYQKEGLGLLKNKGRMFARLEGVKHARGQWCLFLNSSTLLHENILSEYSKAINQNPFKGYIGSVYYTSKDKIFESYLNGKNRGSNKMLPLAIVPYYNVLLSNCLIRSDILNGLDWNTGMNKYGGEELNFAFSLYLKYPNIIRLYKSQSSFFFKSL